ncbi:MFS general substrate transporter [Pseudovirgaria hyperparasitica]|uniref:MFS general substrate transporter n=1 Tax=Pseudovirgaria hyperparasitica TaxID=470096 RepID=A0A6A6W1R6_9PEZI|nr:MFS general substrate transporter [Pseudovirgaria hyperparasitica]KAF2755944.1 MFS general substrate transporter [Pseudovirgaria hyperparasitica]
MFYRRHQLMLRIGLFYSAAFLAGAFGGLLATGLAQIETSKYRGWPSIFFIEGAIAVLAKFLTEEERDLAVKRMNIHAGGASAKPNVDIEKFNWDSVKVAILNFETAVLSLLYFAIITPIYSFSLLLPTILRTLAYSKVITQLLTVPPNMGGFLAVLMMLGGVAVAIVGYIMLIASARGLVQYGGTFLVAAGIFPCSPLILGWLSNDLAPH